MHEIVYILCAATSLLCAWLLARSHRRSPSRLLLWSMLCFLGLGANNVLLVVDLVVVPDVDLSLVRSGTACAAMLLLVVGLVWESR
jgi:hypothetical protein